MPKLSREEEELIVKQICTAVKAGPMREYALHNALLCHRSIGRREYIERAVQLQDKKTGKWGRWRFNRVQRYMEALRLKTQRAGLPERYVTLKARKWGFSTLWLGYGIEYVTRTQNARAVIVADETDSANALLEMGKLMKAKLPFKLPVKYENRSVLYFDDPVFSLLDIETAKSDDPCRGGMYRFAHCTEPQIWPDPERRAIAIENAVPDEPNTVISYEGTGHGMNWWHDFWMRAHNGKSNWKALFFPWWYDKNFDYSIKLVKDQAVALLETVDDEERELLRLGLDVEQLAWRRAKIENTFRGNLDLFHQEFPSVPREAFLASGRPAFVPQHVMAKKVKAKDPIWKGTVLFNEDGKGRMVADPSGPLWLWSMPSRSCAYAIGVDVGHGVPNGDESVAVIIDARTSEQVGVLLCSPEPPARMHVRPKEFGRMVDFIGREFGNAYILPEIEGPGVAFLEKLRELSYPTIGRRETYDKIGRRTTEKLGWSTNHVSRPVLFNEIREHLALDDGAQINDHRLASQMLEMYLDSGMKEQPPSGGHDDYVVAWGIALMARRYALNSGWAEEAVAFRPRTETEMHWEQFEADCATRSDDANLEDEEPEYDD